MGLDMYLYADRYFAGYAHRTDESYSAILAASGLQASPDSPHLYVRVCVAYWRKANQVHAWFVDHVQNGVDECQLSDVTREDLQELYAAASEALGALETGKVGAARALLPAREGFFFGPTDDDEWYADDLRETVAQLAPILAANPLHIEGFAYRASW